MARWRSERASDPWGIGTATIVSKETEKFFSLSFPFFFILFLLFVPFFLLSLLLCLLLFVGLQRVAIDKTVAFIRRVAWR